jgi:hypothetical protein
MAADPALVALMVHQIPVRRPVFSAGPTPGPSSYTTWTIRAYVERDRIRTTGERGQSDTTAHVVITDGELQDGDQAQIPGVSSPEWLTAIDVTTFWVPYDSTTVHHREARF